MDNQEEAPVCAEMYVCPGVCAACIDCHVCCVDNPEEAPERASMYSGKRNLRILQDSRAEEQQTAVLQDMIPRLAHMGASPSELSLRTHYTNGAHKITRPYRENAAYFLGVD